MMPRHPVLIQSSDHWVKVVEMLQQNWALIDDDCNTGGAVAYFVDDASMVFDRMSFPSRAAAEGGLRRNGFRRFEFDRKLRQFLAPPQPPFHEGVHPNGPIYSSGRFWVEADEGTARALVAVPKDADVASLAMSGRLRVATDPGRLGEFPAGGSTWDRAAGMMLGLAIGDSLGNTSESQIPADRRARHGEIRDYLPNRHADGRRVGLPSDDTQLALRTLEHLLEHCSVDPQGLADRLASGQIFGIGSTMRGFLAARKNALHWLDAAQESAGNGALMRIAPVILPYAKGAEPTLWRDAVVAGAVTHNDFASNAACGAFVAVLWDALLATPPVKPGFWLDRFGEVARVLEGGVRRYTPRAPHHEHRSVALAEFTDEVVRDAVAKNISTVDACNDWYSGAYLLETVPSVLYILERHGNDPEEAIVRAVNDTRDNDTIAAIVGAAVGALHGAEALPLRWRDSLLGRSGADDDGRVQQLIDAARGGWL